MEHAQILNIVGEKLNITIDKDSEIPAGMNNKLYKLYSNNETVYLLKIYEESGKVRMQREVSALKFLSDHGFTNVPKVYLSDMENGFAVYSFIYGVSKQPNQVNRSDIEQMAKFMADVHKIEITSIASNFLNANFACFAIQNYIDNISFRLKKFESYASVEEVHVLVKNLYKTDIVVKVNSLVENLIKDIDKDEIVKTLDIHDQRLSPVDFGVHNMLFHNDNSYFLDFEYFGKDDPARAVGDFIKHDRSVEISQELKDLFLKMYLDQVNLGDDYRKHLDLVTKLIDIEWLGIYLFSMTPEKIKIRKFSDANFHESKYLEKQIQNLNTRLALLQS